MTRQQAIRDLILMLTGKEPPFPIRVSELRKLSDERHMEIQGWLVLNLRMQWLTGIGAIEAIDSLVGESVSNGNLRDYRAFYPPDRSPRMVRTKGKVKR